MSAIGSYAVLGAISQPAWIVHGTFVQNPAGNARAGGIQTRVAVAGSKNPGLQLSRE
jgi:hypothetical protein